MFAGLEVIMEGEGLLHTRQSKQCHASPELSALPQNLLLTAAKRTALQQIT